ncbi:MAG: LemA family protein [Bacteroidales bacterium]|nr:LemA family protein [Bacteroidales bacterium]
MKKTLILIVAVAAIVLWGISIYNKMVQAEETVSQAWGNVENAYQRRADLIPNLLNIVKGAAEYEKSTYEAVVNARAAATQTKIDANSLTEENLAQFQAAQDQLSSSLSRLLVTVEAYPEFKANANFREFQAQLEGTENRINTERNRFNDVVKPYNTFIRKFPQSLFAGVFGFSTKAYFKAAAGAENAPSVQF